MDQQEKLAFKASLKRWALDHLGQLIATTDTAMHEAQEAANSEEKSSAGDKYETGRAMGHLQKDMYAKQLADLVRMVAALHAVNTEELFAEGKTGALLHTDSVDFFISIGLGKKIVNGRNIVFLSPHAPLAGALQNKRSGDTIPFGRETLRIIGIF